MIILIQKKFSKIPKALLTAGKTVAGGVVGGALLGAIGGFYRGKRNAKQEDFIKGSQEMANFFDKKAEENEKTIKEMKTQKWKKEDAKWRKEYPDEVTGEEDTIKSLEDNKNWYEELAEEERDRAERLKDPEEWKKEKRKFIKDRTKLGAEIGSSLGAIGSSGILIHKAKRLKTK